tara:strand:+ start:103 stop:321 length:219 start_codon:yes stop_codon:yes gene_type:complete
MFNCKVYQLSGEQEIILLCKEFKSLKDIANELGLTYSQVADFSARRNKKNYKNFKFFPKIEINRIYKENKHN